MEKDFTKEYAIALFDLSLEEKKLETIKEQLALVSVMTTEYDSFMKIMTHPQVTKEEKKDVIKKVFKGVDQSLLHFLYVIIDHNRFNYIQYILEDFIKLYHEYNKVIPVKAITTIELSEEQIKRIKDKLETKYKHIIEVENVIDPSIVAGMRLIVNNEVIDYSLKSQLNNLKAHILKQT